MAAAPHSLELPRTAPRLTVHIARRGRGRGRGQSDTAPPRFRRGNGRAHPESDAGSRNRRLRSPLSPPAGAGHRDRPVPSFDPAAGRSQRCQGRWFITRRPSSSLSPCSNGPGADSRSAASASRRTRATERWWPCRGPASPGSCAPRTMAIGSALPVSMRAMAARERAHSTRRWNHGTGRRARSCRRRALTTADAVPAGTRRPPQLRTQSGAGRRGGR